MGANNVEISLIVEDLLTKQYKRIHNDIVKTNKKTTKSVTTMAAKQKAASKQAVQGLKAQSVAAVALAGILTGVLTKSFIDAQRNVDRIMNALKVGTGSTKAATVEFKFLEAEANRLGLELQSTALSYAQLTAAAKNTNLTAMEQREIFIGVAEAGAALGLSASDMEGALRAVQQMISKGNVQAEELRGQLGERIPGAFSIAAKAMGLTEKQLNKQLELGNILAEDMLPKLAKELRATFGSTAAEGANNLNGKINALKNTVFAFQRQILADGGEEILKDFFDVAAKSVKLLGENMDKAIIAGKIFFTVFAAGKLASVITNLVKFGTTLTAINPAFALLAATMAAIELSLNSIEEKAGARSDILETLADKKLLSQLIDIRSEYDRLSDSIEKNVAAGFGATGLVTQQSKALNALAGSFEKLTGFQPDDPIAAQSLSLNNLLKQYTQLEVLQKKTIDPPKKKKAEVEKAIPQFKGNTGFEQFTLFSVDAQDEREKVFGEMRAQFDATADAQRAMIDEMEANSKRREEGEDKRAKKETERLEKAAADRVAFFNTVLDGASGLTSALGNLAAVQGSNELKQAEAAGASEEKLNSIRKKTFEKQKQFQLASAGMAMGSGVVNALTVQPANLVPVAVGFALATGATNIAAIEAQEFAGGGIVGGNSFSGDNVPVQVNSREMILNTTQQKNLLAMANGGGGGGSQITFEAPVIHVQNGDAVSIGNAVSDTYQEMLNKFALSQEDSQIHELI